MAFRKPRTYLDHAAAAPASNAALRAFTRAHATSGNPSSPHAEGRAARDLLEDARLRIARLAGTKQDAVIFTSGATEANVLGIVGHIRALTDAGRKDLHALYHPGAHASVIGAMQQIEALGVEIEPMELASLEAQIRPGTVLVAIDLVCGETGTIYKTRDVRRVLDRTGSRIT